MKNKIFSKALLILLTLVITFSFASCKDNGGGEVLPDFTDHVALKILPGTTKLVHSPSPMVVENIYRYGPSMMFEDKTLHMWTSSPGRFKTQWDWIRYRSSANNGTTWSDETIALKPTPGTDDAWSVCDPGGIKIGEYYYVGYTSCYNTYGRANNVFIARSKNVYGPFDEKWAGDKWSFTEAVPVIYYDVASNEQPDLDSFGAGEPTFTVVDGTIYMYYTWDKSQNNVEDGYVKVATAAADDPNWPGKLQDRGVAFARTQVEDSGDVAYLDAYKRFVFVSVGRRYMDNSRVVVRQSIDGITWDDDISYTTTNFTKYAHNGGISKDTNGHIKKGDNIYLAYAHAQNINAKEVNWATRMSKVTFTLSETAQDDDGIPTKLTIPSISTTTGTNPQAVFVSDPYVRIYMGDPTHQLRIKLLNNNMHTSVLGESDIAKIKFYGYDKDIISISSSGLVTAKKMGTTHVYMTYNNDEKLGDNFIIYVGDSNLTQGIASSGNTSLFTDSDVDTEFKTNDGAGEKWFGLETKDKQNAPLKGFHLYSQIEAKWFPETYKVQVRKGNAEWTDVAATDWSYHFLTIPSPTTAITPVTIVLNDVVNVSGVRILGSRSLPEAGIGVSRMEAFASDDELKIISSHAMKTEYTLDCADTTGLYKSAQIKLYVAYNFQFQYEVYNSFHGVVYSIEDSSIATVDNKGMITAVKPGVTNVTAVWKEKSFTIKVTVK